MIFCLADTNTPDNSWYIYSRCTGYKLYRCRPIFAYTYVISQSFKTKPPQIGTFVRMTRFEAHRLGKYMGLAWPNLSSKTLVPPSLLYIRHQDLNHYTIYSLLRLQHFLFSFANLCAFEFIIFFFHLNNFLPFELKALKYFMIWFFKIHFLYIYANKKGGN